MGKKLATIVLASELLAGVSGLAFAPGVELPFKQPSKQEINQIDESNFVDPRFEKTARMAAEIGREIQLINGMVTEQEDRRKSDPIYNLIFQVYDSVKDKFDLPSYFTPEFLRADVFVESTDYRYAVSKANAKGYLQMTSAAAEDVGVDKSRFEKIVFNPWDVVDMSMAYYASLDNKRLSKTYPGWDKLSDFEKLRDLADAYNMGYGAFLSKCFDRNGNFTEERFSQETKDYFPKILNYWKENFPKSFEYFTEHSLPKDSNLLNKYLPIVPDLREAEVPSSSKYQRG